MISDHGNQLVRQINLKVEDCAKSSQSVLGMPSAWLLALAVGSLACCLLLGLIAGFYIRPYVVHREGSSRLHYSETWKHFPNQSGEESTDTLLRLQKRNC